MADVRLASEIIADTRALLAGAPQESLGRDRKPRFRAPRIVRVGSAWHLGVLLLSNDAVFSTAEVIRAASIHRRGYSAESARERAHRRDQARRGGFAEGEVVHVGWQQIDLGLVDAGESSGPLSVINGTPMLAWTATGNLTPLESYLRERCELGLGR